MSSSDRLWRCRACSTPWLSAYAVGALWQRWRLLYSLGLIAVSYTLVEGVAMALGAG